MISDTNKSQYAVEPRGGSESGAEVMRAIVRVLVLDVAGTVEEVGSEFDQVPGGDDVFGISR
jgi:NADPH:quinone reductase-like Zn-dependent oxidoreductase